jgi:hypothetical protein
MVPWLEEKGVMKHAPSTSTAAGTVTGTAPYGRHLLTNSRNGDYTSSWDGTGRFMRASP